MAPTRPNCIVFAFGRWFRAGGYLIVRRSRAKYGWWPHFMWSPDLRVIENFAAVRLSSSTWYWPFPPVWFLGTVRRSRMRDRVDG
jgi:hypothetical protein